MAYLMRRLFLLAILFVTSAALVGCATAQAGADDRDNRAAVPNEKPDVAADVPAEPPKAEQDLNEGYALLITLCEKNRDVDKLLWLKSVPAKTKPLIQQSAGLCSQIAADLPNLFDLPPEVSAKETGLPELEARARRGIEQERTGTLLGLSGKALERELLLAQIQAMRYAYELCIQVGEADPNEQRAAFLEDMAARIADLNKQLEQRLVPAES